MNCRHTIILRGDWRLFAGNRAPHTKRARSCGSAPECYTRTVAEQITGTFAAGDGQDRLLGKEGWFGREGQPPGPSMTVTHLTQVGVIIWLGNNRRMTPIDPDGPQIPMVSQPWGASLRLRKNDLIGRFRIVALLGWRGIRRWNRTYIWSGRGPIGLLLGAM